MTQDTTAVALDLTIRLQSALHIGTGLGLAQILDDRIVQGPHPGTGLGTPLPYIPGSSLKGRLRHHVRTLSAVLLDEQPARVALERRLFGFSDTPGAVIFADAHLADTALAQALARGGDSLIDATVRAQRSFVSLSRVRRVALEQRLFRIELAGGGLTFTGTIHGRLPTGTARRDVAYLVCAIRDMTHLGGHKGRGLGKCDITIETVTIGAEEIGWRTLVGELRGQTNDDRNEAA